LTFQKIPDLETFDSSKKKIGILSLSAIKLSPLIQQQYTLNSLSKQEFKSVREFLHNTGYVADNYRQWLASADIQVLPILFFESLKDILTLMDSLDGFVLTGGSESFFAYEGIPSLYLKTVEHLLRKAKEINDSGRVFPVWGTCLGFEALLVVESGATLKRHQVFNHVKLREKIQITDTSLRSVGFFTEHELDEMERIPLLYFNHMWGLSRWDILNLPELLNRVKVGAKINTEAKRNVAVWMEFKDYPFFGTQFHPEKRPVAGANPFDQKRKAQIEEPRESGNKDAPVSNLGEYSVEKLRMQSFFNSRKPGDPVDLPDSNKPNIKGSGEGLKNVVFRRVNEVEIGSSIDDGENGADDIPEDEVPTNVRGVKRPEIVVKKELQHDKTRNTVFVPKVNVSSDSGDSKEKEGVDSIAAPLVDPKLIDPKYLKLVERINLKFADFFGGFVGNSKREISTQFLGKQILLLKNIGSYYEVNLIRNKNS
jgi:anthranilate/para-aminobenzoate synthase component II